MALFSSTPQYPERLEMKKSSAIEKMIEAAAGFVIASLIVLVVMSFRAIVWPLLKFCIKAVVRMLRRALAFMRVVKVVSPARELPTPEVFKGSTNLAPARQICL